MAATKIDAVRILIRAARSERGSQAEVNRIVRACVALGMGRAEIIETLSMFDYCDTSGKLYRPNQIRLPASLAGA